MEKREGGGESSPPAEKGCAVVCFLSVDLTDRLLPLSALFHTSKHSSHMPSYDPRASNELNKKKNAEVYNHL